jgi:hypothetical protein
LSTGIDASSAQAIEQERRRIGRHLDEVARLAESDSMPATFFGELLKRLLDALAAPAGAVWMRTIQGHFQVQAQISMQQVGLDKSEETRQSHEELLRLAITQPKPLHLLPRTTLGPPVPGKAAAGNPTDYLLLLVPVLQGEQVLGFLEVWQGPNRPLTAVPGFLQYMGLMADLCARHLRHQKMGQLAGQQQLWTQLEVFARQVHASLNPIEVAYNVANESRRLIDCDRVSVAIRAGQSTRIAAVSGSDVVETRSSQIQLMKKLADRVIVWGETLTFTGAKDESLPPRVLEALDEYLAEANSKLLVIQPLKDERQKDKNLPARSALIMECFDPPEDPQQLIARQDIVGKHAATALYNAVEHRRIPMRFLWMPLATVQEGVGGKTKAATLAIIVALFTLLCVLVLVPYPLKLEATGQLLPETRRAIYPGEEGRIEEWVVVPGETIEPHTGLARLYSKPLADKINQLRTEIANARAAYEADIGKKGAGSSASDTTATNVDKIGQEALYQAKTREMEALIARTNANPEHPEYFSLKAPDFTALEAPRLRRKEWTVLSNNFRDEWTGRTAKPTDPVLRLGAKEGPWEIELKIPQKHIGQVRAAYDKLGVDTLDVDFLLSTDKTRTYRGRLPRSKIAAEATPKGDDATEPEPVVIGYVRIAPVTRDGKPDIPDNMVLPKEVLLSGAEVKAKVRCGDHAMGYSLFYGVWEFLYDKVIFWF